MDLQQAVTKTLSESDVKSKFVVKADWLGGLLPGNLAPGSQTNILVVDEEGHEFNFVLKVRSRDTGIDLNREPRPYYMKPEFMAKGWKDFVKQKGVKAGRTISFGRLPDSHHIGVRIEP